MGRSGEKPWAPGILLALGQALVQHLWRVQVNAARSPIKAEVGRRAKAGLAHIGALRGAALVQSGSPLLHPAADPCKHELEAEDFFTLPRPLPSPLPEQGSATGFKQSWKLGTEARSRKEPSLLLCVWAGFCAAAGSTNMFQSCLLH